ncbi:baseplate protein [Pectobacterium phage PP101]|uniref:Baseplate protein n=1 Tax=Pectobacterium phage PP101 TaxID=1916414 RepID=A0A1J0MEV5_9CAUD|nr:baseplate hub [Pectobacterium phage PP101]APD19723.1 baseplate protein [Pectobacterium phage PP101]
MPWMRRVEVIITNKDDASKKTVFSKHKIDFEVRSTVGWPADTANITLYNLSLEEVKFLQDRKFGNFYIEIRVGYEDTLSDGSSSNITVYGSGGQKSLEMASVLTAADTVFSGVITNAVGYKRSPEHVTQLYCISKAYLGSTQFKQMRNIKAGSTLGDAIKSMCEDYGFGTVSKFGVKDEVLAAKLPRGRVFHDTFLVEFRALLGEYNLLFQMTTSEIQIFPDTYGDKDAVVRMSKDRQNIRLDVNQVIGNPIAGICTYRLNTFINASIQPGMIIDVTPLLGKEILANGVTAIQGAGVVLNTNQAVFQWAMEDKYFIMEVVHFGSTHATEFQTSISAIIGGNSAMGLKEMEWQDMYARAGMTEVEF